MKLFLSLCERAVTAVSAFARNCLTQCPVRYQCSTLIVSLAANLLLASAFIGGCATSSKGLAREQQVYSVATNVVAHAQEALPYVPAPVSAPLGIILSCVSGLLALWNTHQHAAIANLKKSVALQAVFTQAPQASAQGTQAGTPVAPVPS